jgi:hypothetical protein
MAANISNLSCFFFTKEDIHPSVTNNPKILYPDKAADTLFGCFYLLLKGSVEYQQIAHTLTPHLERQLKFNCAVYLSQRKADIHTHHGQPFTHYQSHLCDHPTIDMDTFFMLCNIYGISVAYILSRCWYASGSFCSSAGISPIDTINVLKIHTVIHGKITYCIEQLPYTSITWTNKYPAYSILSPLPPMSRMKQEEIDRWIDMWIDPTAPRPKTKASRYALLQSFVKLM